MGYNIIYILKMRLFFILKKPCISAILLLIPHIIFSQNNGEKNNSKVVSPAISIQQIDSVVNYGLTNHNPQTYFAALYNTMVGEIYAANQDGHFTDSVLIDYIQNNFTQYYLRALNAYTTNDSLPYAWKAALDTQNCKNCSYVQWLALGTNAHINYDLYFILLEYFKTNGTANHNDKKARKEFFMISARETDRIVKNFVRTDPNINWLEGFLIKNGKNGVKMQMKQFLKTTWQRAIEATEHPERKDELTRKQMQFIYSNAQKLLNPHFPIKLGFNMMKSLDQLSFETQLQMLEKEKR